MIIKKLIIQWRISQKERRAVNVEKKERTKERKEEKKRL